MKEGLYVGRTRLLCAAPQTAAGLKGLLTARPASRRQTKAGWLAVEVLLLSGDVRESENCCSCKQDDH